MNRFRLSALLAFVATSYWLLAARPGDVLANLGITSGTLRQNVLLNLKEPQWFFFNATGSMRQMARQIPQAARAETVRMLGNTVRAYVQSAAFKQDWLQDLRSYYPYDDSFDKKPVRQDDELAKTAVNQQMAAMEQSFGQLDPAMLQLAIRSQVTQQEQQLSTRSGDEQTEQSRQIATLKKLLMLPPAELKKQYLLYMRKEMTAQANRNQASNDPEPDPAYVAQQRKQKSEFDAHADFKPLLKKRLQDFITLSSTIDFDARLVPMGAKQRFANPVYEHKPAEWKFLYRLGREPVLEAQAVAQQWLADLK